MVTAKEVRFQWATCSFCTKRKVKFPEDQVLPENIVCTPCLATAVERAEANLIATLSDNRFTKKRREAFQVYRAIVQALLDQYTVWSER